MLRIGAGRIDLPAFAQAVAHPGPLEVAPEAEARIAAARQAVDAHAAGDTPVYGLNTGLGANLGHRIDAAEIAAFQHQLLAGRAVATGAPLPREIGAGTLLARIVSAARGESGISPPLFAHLVAVFSAGLAPAIPQHGSIGAGDLVQNAVFGLALLGEGRIWRGATLMPAAEALSAAGLTPPPLAAKDAMVLANHSGLTVARAAMALAAATRATAAHKAAILLAYEGYGANREILEADTDALRPAPGQQQAADWFRTRLDGAETAPRRIQEALSFRTVAPVTGALDHALAHAVATWEDEANGCSDSPVVLADGTMRSTANFHSPALALALESLSLATAMAAAGAVQRIQKLMTPELSGLPRYLSPSGGRSAGMVPLQKTAAALAAEIRRHAMPVAFDPAPVSDAVEDLAPMTPLAAAKLADQAEAFRLLAGAEALVAHQALHLRAPATTGAAVASLDRALRAEIPPLVHDRALGPDIARAADILDRHPTA